MSVVFPEPLRPITATYSPGEIVTDTPSSRALPPISNATERVSIACGAGATCVVAEETVSFITMIGPTDPNGGQNSVEVNLGEHVEGRYSNVVMITHTATEVILDFSVHVPGLPGPKVVSRIIITPEHAKRLLSALDDNIKKYEKRFGTIHHPEERNPPA